MPEDLFEWLKKKLKTIKIGELVNSLYKLAPDTVYSPGEWTAIKLLFLMAYVNIYTKIISNYPRYFHEMYYIDLFAGSGLNKLGSDLILGSPLIASLYSVYPFNKLILIEKNPQSNFALKKRLDFLKEQEYEINYKLYPPEDCNKLVDDIIDKYLTEPKVHYLAFIDPEGLELKWETLERLLSYQGDLIINFQTSGIARVWGQARSASFQGSSKSADTLTGFFGDNSWQKARNASELLTIYLEKIKEKREIVEFLPVRRSRNPGDYHYEIIYATRKTKGGSPWIAAVRAMKNKLESITGELVKDALDVLAGRSIDLFSFFSEETERDSKRQSSLSDWF